MKPRDLTTRWIVFGLLLGVFVASAFGAAARRYAGNAGYSLTGPVTGIVTCVQHDTNELATEARTVRFNTAGTCKLGFRDGTTYSGTWAAGERYDGLIIQVFDTGTSIADADIQLGK